MHQPFTYSAPRAFGAMSGGWLLGYFYFAVYMVHFSNWHRVTDFNFFFFWTALFALLAVFTTVPVLFWLLGRLNFNRQPVVFLTAVVLWAPLSLVVLLLPFMGREVLFLLREGSFYLLYAAVVGAGFGLAYLLLGLIIGKRVDWLSQGGLLAFPPLLVAFLLYGLPYLAPALAFRYFGDTISDRAAKQVLARYHPGDQLGLLSQQLPGLLGDESAVCVGCSGIIETGGYRLTYANGIITELKTIP